MKTLQLAIILFCSSLITAQSTTEAAIIKVIDDLFDGMRAADSVAVKPLFVRSANLSSITVGKDNKVRKQSSNASGLISAIGMPKEETWDEIIWSYDIKSDGPLATAWTEYTFYRGDKLSHCGVNIFELVNVDGGWRISGITDTRRTQGCRTREAADIDSVMDNWHNAAATADEDLFFGSMTEDAVYIGTDKSERWLRDDMRAWSKEYFDKDSAWSFTKVERNTTFSEDKSMAWFDEILDTWMGPCRGSGVLVMTDDGWKIKHYHLSIAVPNESVDGYLNLIGLSRKK